MTHTAVYNQKSWRDLPRDYCIAHELLGGAVGPCNGLIHHHHVQPDDPASRTVQCCQIHHNKIHAILRGLNTHPRWRTCAHRHTSREARESCERRLNGVPSSGVTRTDPPVSRA